MTRFSQRLGITPLVKDLQRTSIDIDTRNMIWNFVNAILFDRSNDSQVNYTRVVMQRNLWHFFFKKPSDELPAPEYYADFIKSLVITGDWWAVYDLIEYIIANFPPRDAKKYATFFNKLFESENCAYRFIENQLALISNPITIDAIESALSKSTSDVKDHLQRAIAMVSDRKNPDYRNAIKEAISAVESSCKYISGKPGGELNECLRIIKKTHELDSHFEQALIKLYTFTNKGSGIRHALTEEGVEVNHELARYMITTCAAFCDYLWEATAKAKAN